MSSKQLSPAARLLIDTCPDIVNALAANLHDKFDETILGPRPRPEITMSFDAELTPEALELLLGKYSPTTLRTTDEIGFTDPITGEVLTFRKVKDGGSP